MLVAVVKTVDVDIKTLLVEAGVRYWEDATVNGVEDTDGHLIPCRDGDLWKPIIDVETGVITNWAKGTVAEIHYKVCDAGIYKLTDASGEVYLEHEGYVRNMLCPEGNGYGDYIKMNVDADGKIANWKVDFSDFGDE